MTDQEQVERFLTAELEQRTAGGESCPFCRKGRVQRSGQHWTIECPDCLGTGKSPAITSAKEALAAYRRERERVERLAAQIKPYTKSRAWLGRILAEYNAPVKEPAQGGDSHEE